MDLHLEGKVAVVTGASRGIGRAVAAELVGAGAKVVLSSRKQEDLDAACAAIGGQTAPFAANAGDPEAAAACVQFAMDTFGAVDVLVNNAATNPYMGPSIGIDLGRYDKTFDTNLRGPLVWTQRAYEASMKEHGGAVVNIASVGGIAVEQNIGIYNTTKAGLIYLTKVLASELGPAVRVNAVAPGLVKTDMARALWEANGDKFAQRLPTRRLGEPEDVARMVVFLASSCASWVTGQTIAVDGGALVR